MSHTPIPQPSYLVLQCYGNEGVFLECAFALLSLSRLYQPEELSNLQIWIYTDKPGWFQRLKKCPLPLYFRPIDAPTIKKWRGDIDFVHRVKIETLIDFTNDKTGNVIYADTDVIFTHRIDEIWRDLGAGQLYMHIMEGKVSAQNNPLLKKLNTYLHKNELPKIEGKQLYDFNMWNAGILGFHTMHKGLLQDALAFTDEQYPKFPKHIVEQFAFSVQFQKAGNLKSALPYILHYWNLKEARVIFASFFDHFKDCDWDDLVKYSGMIQIYDLVLQKIRFEYNRSFREKLFNKKWLPENYDWDQLIV